MRWNTKARTWKTIAINRTPVVTLGATVVAQRLGFVEDEALTLGKAVTGRDAQAQGRRLSLFQPQAEKAKKARPKEPGERFGIESCGRLGRQGRPRPSSPRSAGAAVGLISVLMPHERSQLIPCSVSV